MYCGSACKQKAYRAKLATQSNAKKPLAVNPGQRSVTSAKLCPHCGTRFNARRSDAIFCSSSCRVVSNRAKQAYAKFVYSNQVGITSYYAWIACEAMGWPNAYALLEKWGYKWVASREMWLTEVQIIAQGELL